MRIDKTVKINFTWHANGRNVDDTMYFKKLEYTQFRDLLKIIQDEWVKEQDLTATRESRPESPQWSCDCCKTVFHQLEVYNDHVDNFSADWDTHQCSRFDTLDMTAWKGPNRRD
jgi:hypothetical protein